MTFDKQLWGGIFMLFVALCCCFNEFFRGYHGFYNYIGMGIGFFAGIGLIRHRSHLK